MGIGNLFPRKEREQISNGTVQNASKRKGQNVRLSDINNQGENSVQTERKYSAASQDGAKLSMPNDENSKKFDRGTKTNETGGRYTTK